MTSDSRFDLLADGEHLWVVLDQFLAGELGPADTEAVRRWLAADPSHAALLGELQALRSVARDPIPPRSLEGAWRRVRLQIGQPIAAIPSGVAPIRTTGLGSRIVRGVVAIAAGAAVAVGIFSSRQAARSADGAVGADTSYTQRASRTFASPRGQRAVFRLVDGTQVVLAPDSRLVVPSSFGISQREVALDGEALFDAVHDSTKPFVVRSRDAVVVDLGTRFVVRGFSFDSAVRVVVTVGRVQLRHRAAPDGSGALLDAGMLAQIDGAGATSVRTGVDTVRYVSWVDGSLVFIGTPFRDVAQDLARWYDIDIELPDSTLAARRLTATIGDQPLARILDQLSISLGADVHRVGRTVTFTPIRPRPMRSTDLGPASNRERGLP